MRLSHLERERLDFFIFLLKWSFLQVFLSCSKFDLKALGNKGGEWHGKSFRWLNVCSEGNSRVKVQYFVNPLEFFQCLLWGKNFALPHSMIKHLGSRKISTYLWVWFCVILMLYECLHIKLILKCSCFEMKCRLWYERIIAVTCHSLYSVKLRAWIQIK